MEGNLLDVRYLHIVAVLQRQHPVAISRNGERSALELGLPERKDVFHVARVVVGNAQSVGLASLGEAAQEAEYRKKYPLICPRDEAYLAHCALCGRRSTRLFVGLPCAVHEFVDVALQLFGKKVEPERLRVEREDVDVHALLFPHAVVAVGFLEPTAAVAHLGIEKEVVGVGARRLQSHRFGQFPGQDFHQPAIVGPEHLDVEVVIPGDEAAVAHGADERSAAQPVSDAVAAADVVHDAEYLQHAHLLPPQQGAVGVEPTAQFFLIDCH